MTRFPPRPTGEPINIREAYLRTMIRYPKTMARLGDYKLISIRQFYNAVLAEPIPDELRELVEKLK